MHFDSSPSLNVRLPLMPLIYCPNLPDTSIGGGREKQARVFWKSSPSRALFLFIFSVCICDIVFLEYHSRMTNPHPILLSKKPRLSSKLCKAIDLRFKRGLHKAHRPRRSTE
jgi:hypothetical protein